MAGDTRTTAGLVGLADAQRAGGTADAAVVARWLDDGVTGKGAHGRAFGERGVHGFDLTFCAPKSVSLIRALRTDDVVAKAIADAHTTALSEAMEYLAAHAGYTRVHNPRTGEKPPIMLGVKPLCLSQRFDFGSGLHVLEDSGSHQLVAHVDGRP